MHIVEHHASRQGRHQLGQVAALAMLEFDGELDHDVYDNRLFSYMDIINVGSCKCYTYQLPSSVITSSTKRSCPA